MNGRPPAAFARSRWAAIALALVVGTAAIETVASAFAYRETIGPADLEAIASHLESTGSSETGDPIPLIVEPRWLEPIAREHFAAASLGSVLPDLRTTPRVWLLTRGDASAWNDDLSRRYALDAPPVELSRHAFGSLSLVELGTGVAPALARIDRKGSAGPTEVFVEGRRCKVRDQGDRPGWDCRPGKVEAAVGEVGYQARECLRVEDIEGRSLQMRWPEMPFGTRLVGHVGFGDFNGRLRSEAAARITLRSTGTGRAPSEATFTATDARGWLAFTLPTTAGRGTLEVEISPSLAGTFDGRGEYGPRPARTLCFELRSVSGLPSEGASP